MHKFTLKKKKKVWFMGHLFWKPLTHDTSYIIGITWVQFKVSAKSSQMLYKGCYVIKGRKVFNLFHLCPKNRIIAKRRPFILVWNEKQKIEPCP